MAMDPRCPRALPKTPCDFCPLAVTRLRAIRTAGKELSEEEEAMLPGCPWAVNSQTANYCFFKYLEEFAGEHTLSDVEVAALNCLSIETVKKIEREALNKIRCSHAFQSLHEELDGESPFQSNDLGHSEYEVNH
jgi:DNA-directed RNA polymerase sigma subunit (sigma70/sigma32)